MSNTVEQTSTQTVTLLFSRVAKQRTHEDLLRQDRAFDGGSTYAEITDPNGKKSVVEYTAAYDGPPEEATERYGWDDKKVVWSGPRQNVRVLDPCEA